MTPSEKLWDWIYQRRLSLGIAIYAISVGWSYILPPNLHTYDALVRWSAIGYGPLGLFNLPFFLIGKQLAQFTAIGNYFDADPSSAFYLLCFACLVIYSLFVGGVLAGVFNSTRRWLKVVFIIPCLLGGFLTAASFRNNWYYGPRSCDHTLSETARLRIAYYTPRHEDFLSSYDGTSWQHLLYAFNINCNQIGSLDEDFFWLWDIHSLIITHDGGEIWHNWDINMFRQQTQQIGYITDVSFDDSLTGEIIIGAWSSGEQYTVAVVQTTDGGLTWETELPNPVLQSTFE